MISLTASFNKLMDGVHMCKTKTLARVSDFWLKKCHDHRVVLEEWGEQITLVCGMA